MTIFPSSAGIAGAKWAVDAGELQSSGATVSGLSVGIHTVSFETISGWISPTNQTVVVSPKTTATASGTYVAIGSLQVTLAPVAVTNGGAQWQVDSGTWRNSGATATNLTATSHTISFKGIDYWTGPTNETVVIKGGTTTKANGTYTFNGAGIYNGLFTNSEVTVGTAGMLQNLVVTTSGAYTGKLLLGATTTSIAGSFNDAGHATNSITPAKLGRVILTMQVNWNQLPVTISGTVSGTNGGAWTANLTAELAASGQASADYTALILPAGTPGMPPGYGYLLITNHAGTVVLSGALADGTSFSDAVPVSGSGDLPIYGNLYGNTGLLIGWINLESGAQAGNLAWIKEGSHFNAYYTNGFTNLAVASQVSPWTNPSPKNAAIDLPAGVLGLTNGALPSPLVLNVSVNPNNTLVKLPGANPTNTLMGTISTVNPTRGLLTITFGNGMGKATTTGTGAVLQNITNAGGYFLGKTNAGVFLLQP